MMLPFFLLVGLFLVAGFINGFDEALRLSFSAPRNLFCSVVDFCDVDEGEVVKVDEIYSRIYERSLLDVGKYETRNDWRATSTTVVVTNSMRMRATAHVTLALNLELMSPDDIVVDENAKTVTITTPPVQNAECFLTDIDYYDESCLPGTCGDLERRLQRTALDDAKNSTELERERGAAMERGQTTIAALIDPLASDYDILFRISDEAPPPVPGGSCN